MPNSDRCHACGHFREEHHYQPGNGCCAEVDRFERCSCRRFKPDPENDPRSGDRRKDAMSKSISRKIGRALRDLAHRVDPQPPVHAATRPGVPFLDFVRGETWLDGERIHRTKKSRRAV